MLKKNVSNRLWAEHRIEFAYFDCSRGLDTLRNNKLNCFSMTSKHDSDNYRHIRWWNFVINSMFHPSCRSEDFRRGCRRKIIENNLIWSSDDDLRSFSHDFVVENCAKFSMENLGASELKLIENNNKKTHHWKKQPKLKTHHKNDWKKFTTNKLTTKSV